MAGVCQADCLTSAEQEIPDWLGEDSISGRVKALIKSSLGLATPFLGLFVYKMEKITPCN